MKKISLVIFALLFLNSCRIFSPSQMLRTGSDFKYSDFPADQTIQEYKISANDELSFQLATNDGEKIVDPVLSIGTSRGAAGNTYLVEFDGMVKFPVLGRIKLSGLTLREAEKLLEESYSKYYNDPFVQLKVTNNRVIIFPGGEGGTSTVLTLSNTNTTLMEALALAGGISDGKAQRVKLIRGDLKNPQVYLIDLSTLEGVKKANLVLQANDIIYVEPRNKIPEKFLAVITPYISLLSLFFLLTQTFK